MTIQALQPDFLSLLKTPEDFARLDPFNRLALQLENPERFALAEKKATLARFERPEQLRTLTATELVEFKRLDPERFERLSSGQLAGTTQVQTREDLGKLTASQLAQFRQADPARFAQLTGWTSE